MFLNALDTNTKGQGNARVELDIDPPIANSSVWVRITVRGNPDGLPQRPYYISKPVTLEIPLK